MVHSRLTRAVGAISALVALALPALATTVSAQQTTKVMSVVNAQGQNRFDPEQITITVGTTVVWESTRNPHTVTSGKPGAPDPAGPLQSPRFNTGDTFQYTFTQPGRYEYFCMVHQLQNQVGVVIVQAPTAPAAAQFGSPLGTNWPPVVSGELQVTIGNNAAIVGLVGNRTANQHAFIDVRWALPTSVTLVDSFANAPQTNRGKFEGLSAQLNQIGWVNHFVRAGQVQGPFYIVLSNASGQSFRTWSWMWFHTGGEFGSGRSQFNGNYTSSGVQTGAPFSWSGEFATAAAASGSTGFPAPR